MSVFKSKPAFISMPACLRRALQAQNSNTPEHHICWHIKTGFILIPRSPGLDLHPRSFKALPVGSKSWVLLQRSTFCFLSAGDSLLRMLPCLWQAKQSLDYCTQQPCSTCESLEITLSSPDGSEFTEMARIVLSAKSISKLSARWKVISQKTEKPPQIVLHETPIHAEVKDMEHPPPTTPTTWRKCLHAVHKQCCFICHSNPSYDDHPACTAKGSTAPCTWSTPPNS